MPVASLHELSIRPSSKSFSTLPMAEGVVLRLDVREEGAREVIGDDDIVAKPVDEGHGDSSGNGGHPVHPVGGEARSQDRDGEQQSSESSRPCVALHLR